MKTNKEKRLKYITVLDVLAFRFTLPVIISWAAFTAAFDFIIKTRSVEAGVIFSFAVLNIWYFTV